MLRHGNAMSVAGAFPKSMTLQMMIDHGPGLALSKKLAFMRIRVLAPYSSDELSGPMIVSVWRRFAFPQGLVADPCKSEYREISSAKASAVPALCMTKNVLSHVRQIRSESSETREY